MSKRNEGFQEQTGKQNMNEVNNKFKGLAINSGKVMGQICLFSAEHHKGVTHYSVETKEEIEKELALFEEAKAKCSKDLEDISIRVSQQVGKAESEIFLTQKHIMNDPTITENIESKIKNEKKNAEAAIFEVFNQYEEKFAKLDNEYIRERSTDIGEIKRRLLDFLRNTKPGFACQGQENCTKGTNRIIVAEELSVGMIATMNFQKVMGFVTEHGGISSHAAIIARSLGVPSVSGIRGIMEKVHCGDMILLDGDNGEIYLDPDEETIRKNIQAEEVKSDDMVFIKTPKGMELLANASLLEDVKIANAMKADGIGLFRTEILFITADRMLSEEEQYGFYKQVMQLMGEKPVTFRLLDVGGDKALPFLNIRQESNPYLGWRGTRFLLGNMEVFSSQLRALARLSKIGKIKIMFPMIIDTNQVKQAHSAVKDILSSTDTVYENIQIGVMFEVPSACLQAGDIFKLVDFGSIGSNDLIQYLFAVDRNNELVSSDYNPEHPVLWDIIKNLSHAAQKERKQLSICGEMAGREGMAKNLINAGIKSLSVSPRLIPRVRNEMAKYVS